MQIGRVQGNLFNYSKMNELKNNGVSNNLNCSSANYCDLPICSPDKMLVLFGKKLTGNEELSQQIYDQLHSIYLNEQDAEACDHLLRDSIIENRNEHPEDLLKALSKKDRLGNTLFISLLPVITNDTLKELAEAFNSDIETLHKMLIPKNQKEWPPLSLLHRDFVKDGTRSVDDITKKIDTILDAYGKNNELLKKMLTKKGMALGNWDSNFDFLFKYMSPEALQKCREIW